ncbi:MAG: Clp protease ClpP [Flavobacteriales bacterium]|nr:Clp protease ClpP [Flavobacteriales bacterium]
MKENVLMKSGPYEIRAAGDNKTELLIYGDIGDNWWGDSVTAKDVVTQLQSVDTDEILVRINSYGGSVSDGLAIYNALKRHDALVTVAVEGVAVSIASLIAMSADTIEISENALFMVHAPWGYTGGNSKELRDFADLLDKYADAMASSYMSKSGKTREDILSLLTDGEDHWYTAQEAIDEGFADVITDEIQIAASGFDLSRFKSIPAAAAAFNQSKPKPIKPLKAKTKTTLTEEPLMNEAEKKIAAAKADDELKVQAAKDTIKAEGERKVGIRAVFKPFMQKEGVQVLVDECIDDAEISVADAKDKVLAFIGKDTTSLAANAHIEMVEDEIDKFKKGASASINVRAGLEKDDGKNDFRGYTLKELAAKSLELNGVDTSRMGKMDTVAAAFTHSTGDFGNLLANSANKALLKGYDEAEETFQTWTTPGELPDFKAGSRVGLNDFPALGEVKEGAEYKYASVSERSEPIILATYGNIFSITRQAIINDDLGAFTRIPQKMGAAAIRTIGDLVYAILTANGNMSDGVALFHANHSNLLTAATISTASVDAMRVAMAKQKAGGKSLNIRQSNLLVPFALEGVAKVVRDSQFEVGNTAATKANTTPNSVAGTFEVISDARLDDVSATAWYGAAGSGMHDTIEVAYLDGNQMPRLEQQDGWKVDGVEFKVSIDAGVSALDYRTLAKNAGL